MVPLKLIQYFKSVIYQQQINKQLNNKVLVLRLYTSQICLIDLSPQYGASQVALVVKRKKQNKTKQNSTANTGDIKR